MVGILCEKPSAARNFAKALGGSSGTYNGEPYLIVAARGHLFEFAQPEAQVAPELAQKYKTRDIANLPWQETDFSWQRIRKNDVAQTLASIKAGLSKCDEITIATDVDPTGEGELLAWEILDELKLRPKKWSRMYFSDESVKEVQKAFVGRKQIPSMQGDMDYVKADYRSKFDFLSMQFTRISTRFGDGHSVLRQGRLKSAMVLIVGDQLKLVSEYKKVPFYQNRFKDENGVVYTNPDEPQFPKKEQVPQRYHASAVILDEKVMKSSAPPKFLDLAALSARLSSGGVKAKDVLAVYQKMYESQVVSYPRTEDKVITPEQFNDLLPLVDKIAAVVGVDPSILTHRSPRSTHVKTGGAHGANRPGPSVPASLSAVEKEYGSIGRMIYETLALNYLACLAEDYEYEAQKGHVADYPLFVGKSNVPKKLGWKAVFKTDADAENEGEKDSEKGLGKNAAPFVYEGFPPKPETPTMKWLMKQLEKHDVGTGATRTSIYADVTNESTKYPLLKETRGKLSMTEFGAMSYRLLPNTHIGNLQITEQLQADMRDIAAGKADPSVCLHRMQQMVMDDLKTMEVNGAAMRKELGVTLDTSGGGREVVGKCPRCGKPVVEGKQGFGCSGWKEGCKFVIWKTQKGVLFQNVTFTSKMAKELLNGNMVRVDNLVSPKTGKTFMAMVGLDDKPDSEYMGTNFSLSFELPSTEALGTCPICKKEQVFDVGKFYCCKGRSNGCSFALGKHVSGATLTVEDVKALLAGKKTRQKDFVWKSGNKGKAAMKLKDDGGLEFVFDAKNRIPPGRRKPAAAKK